MKGAETLRANFRLFQTKENHEGAPRGVNAIDATFCNCAVLLVVPFFTKIA